MLQGQAPGPLSAASTQSAFVNALTRKIQELVVTVSSDLIDVQRQTSEGASVDITLRQSAESPPIAVRGARLEQSCATESGRAVYASVSLAVTEWKRLVRLSQGGLLLVVGCTSSPDGGCSDATHQKTAQVVSEARFEPTVTLAAAKGGERATKEAVMRLADEHRAAYVLWIRLQADEDGHYMDDIYKVLQAVGQMTATYWDATDGHVVAKANLGQPPGSGSVGRIRGTCYEDAGMGTALGNAIHELLRGDADSGSLETILPRWGRGQFSH